LSAKNGKQTQKSGQPRGFTGRGEAPMACHSEESVIASGGRRPVARLRAGALRWAQARRPWAAGRGIPPCHENNQSEISLRRLTDRNASSEGFFRSL
jgi:hypothetical protein